MAVVVAVAIVAVVRFEMLCFKDLAGRRHAELSYLSRTGWTVLIAIMIPIGGICYLFLAEEPLTGWRLVETRGIEPLTPALQRRCSTN